MSKLFKPDITLGLDIGSRYVKLIQFHHTPKGIELINLGMDTIPPEIIVDGTVMDFEPVVKVIQKLLKQLDIKNLDVNTAVAGKAVIVKKVKLPFMTEKELNETIHWEAEQFIPFDMDDVILDFQILSSNPKDKNMDVLLAAVKKEKINNHMNLLHTAGLNPVIIDTDAFALENAYESGIEPNPELVTALVNIGCSITNINIVSGGIPLFTRDISMGGNNFTKALQKELLLNFEEAEQMKIGFGKEETPLLQNNGVLNSTVDKEVEEIMEKVMNEFALEISHSFDYYHSTSENKKVNSVILSGGTAKTYKFDQFLSQKLGLKLEVNNPFKNIIINENKFDLKYIQSISPLFTVSVGLALRRDIRK